MLMVILVAAIFNYFIGTFIPSESKERRGVFGYNGMKRSYSSLPVKQEERKIAPRLTPGI